MLSYGILMRMATTTKKTTRGKTKTAAKAAPKAKTVKKPAKKVTKKVTKASKSSAAKVNKPSLFKRLFKRSGGKSVASKTKVLSTLRNVNLIMAVLYLGQGLVLLFLSNAKSFPVSTSFLNNDQLAAQAGNNVLAPASQVIFDVRYSYLIAVLMLAAAVAHLLVSTLYRNRYEDDIQTGASRSRWLEACVGVPVILTLLASLVGVYDLTSLMMIWALTLVMHGIAWAVEKNKLRQPLVYLTGLLAGATPWAVIGIYLWHANTYGAGQIPAFVYWAVGSTAVFFLVFGWILFKQYKQKGRWADYLYGERAFIVLAFAAKTALAWQIYCGLLR